MRKILLTLIVFLILIINFILIYPKKEKEVLDANEENKNNFLSMMLESEVGSNKYIEKTDLKFPLEGYHFNSEKSGCENGGILSWNEEKQKVQASLITSDKCYAYFDKNSFNIDYDFIGNYETFIVPVDGEYKIELWGASGNDDTYGGKGAYTTGNISLKKEEKIYIYVGEKGIYKQSSNLEPEYTFNGGASGSLTCLYQSISGRNYFGGGATDVRLKEGEWDNFDSLKSRIMVAAGGGGSYFNPNHHSFGGAGGKIEGIDGQKDIHENIKNDYSGFKATQVSGGNANGNFGKGGHAILNTICEYNEGAGGGSGYYGGGGTRGVGAYSAASGAGGSSFISGYLGCDAIAESSTEDAIVHTNQPVHYSGKVFSDAEMIAGNETMPSPDGATEVGHTGNGYAKITLVK